MIAAPDAVADAGHLPRGRCGLKFDERLQKRRHGDVTFREEGVD